MAAFVATPSHEKTYPSAAPPGTSLKRVFLHWDNSVEIVLMGKEISSCQTIHANPATFRKRTRNHNIEVTTLSEIVPCALL